VDRREQKRIEDNRTEQKRLEQKRLEQNRTEQKHMDSKCWDLPENANRRPKSWKRKKVTEVANVACDGQSGPTVELLLSNIDDEMQFFPDSQAILLDPNVWIRDTVATAHMTPHAEGMVNMKNIKGGITVGNGEVMVAKKMEDTPCELCYRHGKKGHSGKITDVALIKNL
jgi:hypothetical protein